MIPTPQYPRPPSDSVWTPRTYIYIYITPDAISPSQLPKGNPHRLHRPLDQPETPHLWGSQLSRLRAVRSPFDVQPPVTVTFWSWCLTWCLTSLRMSTGFCWGEVIHPFILGNGWVGNPINPGPMAKFLFCPKQKNPHGRKVGVVEILSTKNWIEKRDLPFFLGEVDFLTEWFCSFFSF